MWVTYSSIVLILILNLVDGNSSSKSRQRRFLIFTPATQFGLLATIAVPIYSDKPVSVGWFYEANYYNVDNATWLEPLLGDVLDPTLRNREKRSTEKPAEVFTRSNLYAFIESMFVKHGYEGRACLLRAVCEAASSHFLHNGLLGDLLQFTLTPSTTMAEEDIEDCFYEAEYLGLEDNCQSYETLCHENPLDRVSLRVEEIAK